MCSQTRKPVISDELRLIAHLALPSPNQFQIQKIKELSKKFETLDKLIPKLIHHKTYPTAYLNIKKHLTNKIGVSAIAKLKCLYQQNAFNYLTTSRQIQEIKNILNAKQIDIKLLKGISLSSLYPEPSMRHCGDIDLLVECKNFDITHQNLLNLGYSCDEFGPLTPHLKKLYLSRIKEVPYTKAEKTTIELHSRLLHYNTTLSKQYTKKILSNLGLSQEEKFIYLCWHATETLHHRIKWLIDLAIIVQGEKNLNWRKIYKQAKKIDALRAVSICLHLLQSIFEIRSNILTYLPIDRHAIRVLEFSINILENCQNIYDSEQQAIIRLSSFWLHENLLNKGIVIHHRYKPSLQEIKKLNDVPKLLYPMLRVWHILSKLFTDFKKLIN